MKPLNGHIILKELSENKNIKGIIIPKQYAANQITFAKVIALPKEKLITDIKENDIVILGYSPVWEKKYKYTINNEDFLIIDEYAILAIVTDKNLMTLIDIEANK